MSKIDIIRNQYFQSFLILILNLICYSDNNNGEFVFDDSVTILKNPDVTNLDSPWTTIFKNDYWGTSILDKTSHKSYRPLTILTFRLEHQYNDSILSSSNMKRTNLLIHIINCCLIMHFYNIIFNKSKLTGFLVSVLFTVHPIHTEAVCGIVSRSDLASALLFLIVGILYFNKYDQRSYKEFKVLDMCFLTLLGVLTGIAVLFKESGIMILPTCIAIDIIRHMKLKRLTSITQLPKFVILRVTILLLMTLVILFYRLRIQNFESPKFKVEDNPIAASENLLTRTLSQSYLYFLNFFLLLCPAHLSFDWSMGSLSLVEQWNDYRILLIVIFYSFLISAIVLGLKFNNRKLMLSLALIVVPFLPASGIIRLGFVIAERILYTPSIGFSILVAIGFQKLVHKFKKFKQVLFVIFGVFLIFHIVKTRNRVIEWKNEHNLFTSALNVVPQNAKVYYNIGRISYDKHESETALKFYKKAIDLHPNYESAHMNLGNLYRELQEYDKAKFHLKKAVEIL